MDKRTNLSDSIMIAVEKLIISSLKPGDKVPTEKELAEHFSVGRSTIRESMKALTVKGLVVRRNEGTFVSNSLSECLIDPLNLLINMEFGNVEDLINLRELLELGAIKVAARKATPETILALERINWQMQEPGVPSLALQEKDIEFHNTIAQATGNAVLAQIINAIRQVIAKNLEDPELSRINNQRSSKVHEELIAAMRDHDAERAYKVMEKYFTMTRVKDGAGKLMA